MQWIDRSLEFEIGINHVPDKTTRLFTTFSIIKLEVWNVADQSKIWKAKEFFRFRSQDVE